MLVVCFQRASTACILQIPGSTSGAPSSLIAVSVAGHVGTYGANCWKPQKSYRLLDAGNSGESGKGTRNVRCWVTDATFLIASKHVVYATSDQR